MVSSTGIVDLFPLIRKYKITEHQGETIIQQTLNLFNRRIHQGDDVFSSFEGYGEVSEVCNEIIRTLLSLNYWIPGKGIYQLSMVEDYNDDLPYYKNLILNHGKYYFKMESA